MPRFRQIGEIATMTKDKLYVVCKVMKGEQISPPDITKPVEEMSLYVEMSYQSKTKGTTSVSGTYDPDYSGQDLAIEVKVRTRSLFALIV